MKKSFGERVLIVLLVVGALAGGASAIGIISAFVVALAGVFVG